MAKSGDNRFCCPEGWKEFVEENWQEFADFLVFNNVRGSEFFVKVFDKTGCLKKIKPSGAGKTARAQQRDFGINNPRLRRVFLSQGLREARICRLVSAGNVQT